MDVQLAAVRLDARAEGLLVERPEVVGDGAHGLCDGGRPENSSPAPAASRGALPRARLLPCAQLHNTTLRCVGATTPSWAERCTPNGRFGNRCRADAQTCSPGRCRIPC